VAGVGDVVFDLHDDIPHEVYREIYGSHVLEHCWPEDTPGILKRLHDSLVPGGTLRLSVPDVRLVVKNCIDAHSYGDERSALSVIYGGTFSKSTTAPDLHRQTFWKERLERLLKDAGFVNIREWSKGQYGNIDALGDYATVPHDATGKSLISLNMEADREGKLAELVAPVVPGTVVDVSVILGTVNRPMVKDCIEAVRSSLNELSYEIVVAYGHVEDTSLSWLREQNDVRLVLGGMEGAIEAFNRAYAVSRGRLICQINDDVLVNGDAIARAVAHLNTNPETAGVAFKFDRQDGKGYRHDMLGGRLHPNQMVVRRETCEAVSERIGAFWGDANHRTDKTYGGDSAFGVLCHHLGLRLDSVEGVTCRDLLFNDALRAQNQAAVSKQHGSRWGAMYGPLMETFAPAPTGDEWPHCYVPRLGMPPRRSPITAGRPLRTLFAPIVVKGWPQRAFRGAFSKIGPYAEILGDGRHDRKLLDLAAQFKPELVFAQVQRDGWREFSQKLRQIVGPECTMVQWTGDVRTSAGEPVEPWLPELAESFDLLLADNCTYPKQLAKMGIRAGYLSCGSEIELVWEPDVKESAPGAVFIGTNYSALDHGHRQSFFTTLDKHLPNMVALYGTGWHKQTHEVTVTHAGQIMRRTPITISKSYINNLERYVSNRLKYAFASGGVTAVERFPDMEGLGLIPGQNCLVWSSQAELIALLQDWTRPEKLRERDAIRVQAAALAAERFTWDRGVEELLAIVRDHRARKGLS
jgi:hypothetical protein